MTDPRDPHLATIGAAARELLARMGLFRCCWCGAWFEWSDLAGFDKQLKFCGGCVRLQDQLEPKIETTR